MDIGVSFNNSNNLIMKRFTYILLFTVLMLEGISCGSGNDDSSSGSRGGKELPGALEPAPVNKSNTMKLYVHYMPWFETPATSNDKKWGQHWTMATCNPEQKDSNGNRKIASHYYPLIGPYASSDAIVLNYHALLMKYSGIDGVMIDWYGTQDKYDYAPNRHNTEELVKAIDRAGLQFAIVYEDQTLKELPDNSAKVEQAIRDMQYLQNNFFNKANYVKENGKPLLLVFGPQTITVPKDWSSIFGIFSIKPAFVVLNNHSHLTNNSSEKNSIGEYLWTNPDPASFYSKATTNFNLCIGGAMPGFHDYYKEGGWGNGYTTYNDENGIFFDNQLSAARSAGLEYLQISTWNDFGEGTNIEPAQEYEYRYLTKLQQFAGTSYNEHVLKQIYRWYTLKQQYADDKGDVGKYLTQAYYYFIALKPDKAEILLNELNQK